MVVCPVWLKHELEGVICIHETGDPLGDLEIQAAEHAATVIALHIARDRAVVNVEQRLRYSFIDTLLDGQFSGDALSLERATLMGFQPSHAYKVAVFILNESLPLNQSGYLRRERLISRITRRMDSHDLPSLISPSMNEIAMVVPGDADVGRITEGLLEASISVCTGEPHAGADGVRASYLEARAIIPWARPGHITSHHETVLPRIFDGDSSAKRQFMDRMLAPIRASLHADTYVDTLKTLVACGFNQTRAAEAMSIHHKTMHYRVNRLQEMLDMPLADSEVRFRIDLLVSSTGV